MTFIEPGLWWGAAALAIPVAIHFWHQRRGKPLPWAATRWLIEKEQQQSRGLQLDNVWLLLLRCVGLLLLVLLLTQPVLDGFLAEKKTQVVHLVQPNALIVNNFRFELTEAIKKGETVLWATNQPTPMQTLDQNRPAVAEFDPLTLQTILDQLPPETTLLHLYAENKRTLADMPVLTVPAPFRLHWVVDSAQKPRPWLLGDDNQKLFINKTGRLTRSLRPDPGVSLLPKPVHSGPIRVLFDDANNAEKQTVRAALTALTEVYGLAFLIDEKPIRNQPYDLVLTDKTPVRPMPETLYIVSEPARVGGGQNMVYVAESLTAQTSGRVATGQLPEWLGSQLLDHLGVSTAETPLRPRELNQLFQRVPKQNVQKQPHIQQFILLLLLVVIIVERAIALTKNA